MRPEPTRDGRWGVHQYVNGKSVGSTLIWCGYRTREDAVAANPPSGGSTFVPFDRHGSSPG